MAKPSQQKITDGSDFLPGKIAIWEGYQKYDPNSQGTLVILVNRLAANSPIADYFEDKELRWICVYSDKPSDPVVLKQSELKIV